MSTKSRESEAIIRLVDRCDLCLVDLDQCVYPRFTQTTLGAILLWRSLLGSHRRCLPRLLSGAAYIARIRSLELFGVHPTNVELMSAFCRVIRGLPLQWLRDCTSVLPRRGPQAWKAALEKLCGRMSIFLLSFAIEPITQAYGEAAGPGGKKLFSGWRGTPLAARDGMVEGCRFSRHSLSPAAKLEALGELCAPGDFHRPLVIGHGADEALMARRARELGGGSIAVFFQPSHLRAETAFDIVLAGRPWEKISDAL